MRRNIFKCFAKGGGGLALLAAFALLAALAGPAPALQWIEPGEGETEGHYEIATPNDLLEFRNLVKAVSANTDADIDAVLTDDIDMTDTAQYGDWEPINPPTAANGYSGTFDGKGHMIKLKGRGTFTDAHFGLFRRVRGGVVKNLAIDADFNQTSTNSSAAYRAGIVTSILNGGTIENVSVYGVIGSEEHSLQYGGGIVSSIASSSEGTDNKILNCANYARITGKDRLGGIVGVVSSLTNETATLSIENCANYGEIIEIGADTSGTAYAGGIVGHYYGVSDMEDWGFGISHAHLTISNCFNAGAIRQPRRITKGGTIGGLLGNAGTDKSFEDYLRVENFFNYGPVTMGNSDTPNGPVIIGGDRTTDWEDAEFEGKGVLSNIFYLRGSGGALFGTRKAENPFTGGANGDDGWGSDALKALVTGMTEEEFTDGTLNALLNGGPGGTADGEPQWAQGRNYPELINFYVDWIPPALTGSADRVSGTEASVTFTSDEDAAYYHTVSYAAVGGGSAPAIDTTGEGTPAAAGETVTITVSDLAPGTEYDVHIAAKDAIGNVSEPLVIRIPLYDPPALAAVSAKRASDAEATVTFTSDEAGEYYYAVVNSGADAPAIDTSGAGAALAAGENTLTLTLTAGAKDVYIWAKDADGDVSELVISIPAYVAKVEVTPGDGGSPPKITVDTNAYDDVSVAEDTKTVNITNNVLTDVASGIESANNTQSKPPVIEINIAGAQTDSNAEFNTSKISLPVKGLEENIFKKIEDDQDVKLIVLEDICEVAIDKGVLAAVIEAADDDVVSVDIVAEKKDKENLKNDESLTGEQKDVLADDKFRGVYDISILVNDKDKLDDFSGSGGKLTIGLPFELEEGESGENVWAYRVDADGWTEVMTEGRFYDDVKELAVFDTDHLSLYSAAYEQSESSTSGGGCSAGVPGGAFAILAALALAYRVKRKGR